MSISSPLKTLKSALLIATVLLFPLFFLPITQEFFYTNKLYLLSATGLLLILCSTIELLISRTLVWKKSWFDSAWFLLSGTVALSVLISSPNKIQAITNPNFGLLMVVSLAIIVYYLVRDTNQAAIKLALNLGTLLAALTAIAFYFQPLKNLSLATSWQFLKNPSFSTFGQPLGAVLYFGFFAVYGLAQFYLSVNRRHKNFVLPLLVAVVNGLAFGLLAYQLTKPGALLLPPFNISWYAAVEILKNPLTALFGVGADNFASLFTRVKDLAYNQSSLWQIASFNLSRSALLQIVSEAGIFALAAFILLVTEIGKRLSQAEPPVKLEAVYLLLAMALFPTSLPLWFLLIVVVADISRLEKEPKSTPMTFSLAGLFPVWIGLVAAGSIAVMGFGYLIGRSYLAEVKFKQALDSATQNNLQGLYQFQQQAIALDPYQEKYRINFSQTNLLVANNIASKAQPAAGTGGTAKTPPQELTTQDKQTISQAIQTAISEAKAAKDLNPQKSSNWENLALIYRNVLNAVQGADVWTIASYQRAIALDPTNPTLMLNLGGVYYGLSSYDDATRLFEQAVTNKPDWANAHYNLAWANYQKGNYQQAAAEMQNVISLIDPKTNQQDYDKAKKDLEEFKKKLPAEAQSTPTPAPSQTNKQLSLPTPVPTTSEPKIQLPKEASPEAK
ncbi:tetratricopeptide repeat protein [Patescibacteria group bacterium]|nr:tetratricopeptide repeat protein [Patescibacteria group bacterium]MCL5091543.1 tetratricopeptide repeat protein [Patescibacteria group bacterium]